MIPKARPAFQGAFLLALLAATVALSCRSPRNEEGETIDLDEAQPREAVERSSAEHARDSRFQDRRKKHVDLSATRD